MTRLHLSTLLAGLLAASPAFAQDRHGGPAAPRPEAAHGPGMRGPARRGPDNHRPAPGGAMVGPHMAGPRPGPAALPPPPANRSNVTALRRTFHASRHFHAPAYRRPAGWYAHRWTYGEILPRFFWTRDYWLSDFADFGLMPPPPGTMWVREGDDALLIDRYSGEVIQVVYGVFY